MVTAQTRIAPSVYPEKSVLPSWDQHRERQATGRVFLEADGGGRSSGVSSATMTLLSRSQILMASEVAAQSQYLLGETI